MRAPILSSEAHDLARNRPFSLKTVHSGSKSGAFGLDTSGVTGLSANFDLPRKHMKGPTRDRSRYMATAYGLWMIMCGRLRAPIVLLEKKSNIHEKSLKKAPKPPFSGQFAKLTRVEAWQLERATKPSVPAASYGQIMGIPPRPGNGYGFYSAETAKTAKNQQIRVLTVRTQPRHGTRQKNEI